MDNDISSLFHRDHSLERSLRTSTRFLQPTLFVLSVNSLMLIKKVHSRIPLGLGVA